MSTTSKGNCYLCDAILGKTAMEKHLQESHKWEKDGQKCSLLKIESAFDKNYWLYIDLPVEKTLSAVDKFLRKIWLECCGHMSEFYSYNKVSNFGHITVRPGTKLEYFSAGSKLSHIYDFGSSTESIITVIGTIHREPQNEIVRLLARNVPPLIKCTDCEETAVLINTEDYNTDNAFYCGNCAENHNFEMMLPVCNSPRMGVCGYDGELDTFEY